MNIPTPSFSVEVDVTNPGQFFACCGLLELAHRLCRNDQAEARFQPGRFDVLTPGLEETAFSLIMDKLRKTTICTETDRGERATHPVRLEEFALTLDWWLDPSGRNNRLKLWAGQQTSLKIVEVLRDAIAQVDVASSRELFDMGSPLTGRFGVDPRAAWNALDVGFSPNDQQMEVLSFPAVELLAAVGLQRFRPVKKQDGFYYATWETFLGVVTAQAAITGAVRAGSLQQYRFEIVDRGSYKGFGSSIPIGDSL